MESQKDNDEIDWETAEIKILPQSEASSKIDAQKLREFMTHLRIYTESPNTEIAKDTQQKIGQALHGNGTPLSDHLKTEIDEAVDGLQKNINDGNAFFLTVNGTPAATTSIEALLSHNDGRTAYMIGKVVTLPRFEGHHLASAMISGAREVILNRYPGAPIVVKTKNAAIKKICLQLGFEDIGERAHYDRMSYGRRISEEQIQRQEKEGYTSLWFDPQNPPTAKKS